MKLPKKKYKHSLLVLSIGLTTQPYEKTVENRSELLS